MGHGVHFFAARQILRLPGCQQVLLTRHCPDIIERRFNGCSHTGYERRPSVSLYPHRSTILPMYMYFGVETRPL